jgi:hypothetical protein
LVASLLLADLHASLVWRTAKASMISGDMPSTQKDVNAGINCGSLVAISTSSPPADFFLFIIIVVRQSRARRVLLSMEKSRNGRNLLVRVLQKVFEIMVVSAGSDQVSAVRGIPPTRRRNRVPSIENGL